MNNTEQNLSSQQTDGSWFDRWFDNSPILPTGQKKIAYQAAGLASLLSELLSVFAFIMVIQTGVEPGDALSGSIILDVVLIIGLFASEPAARNFTLFRVFAGIFLLPFIALPQLGVIVAIIAFLYALIELLVQWLLLIGETTKRRIFLALALQLVTVVTGSIIALYLIKDFIAVEHPLELRCETVSINGDNKSGSDFLNPDVYGPGKSEKQFGSFLFAVDYSYRPEEDAHRHVITITVTTADSGQLLSIQRLDDLTDLIVNRTWAQLPRRNPYEATGYITVQHPHKQQSLSYLCRPYTVRSASAGSGELNIYQQMLNRYSENRR